ncbi:hypothetical protein HMPREF1015_00981 [Bacillus smithii 7_3_47FAA]|uniref:Uncharacterized protein n=1 Tax=Bacillus smithii 7_3_47FAA TaxID=665952 RepID=G9QGS2_9BACI|nr:hypothetical protein HMPREF1015_00981 [Bacillus smithii 7_3_47FAA]
MFKNEIMIRPTYKQQADSERMPLKISPYNEIQCSTFFQTSR